MCVGKVHGKGHQERYTLKWRKDTPLKTWLNRYRQRWESSKTEPFALQHPILYPTRRIRPFKRCVIIVAQSLLAERK